MNKHKHTLIETLSYYDGPILILTQGNLNNNYLGLYLFNEKYLTAYLNEERLDLLMNKGLEIREAFLNTERPLIYLSISLEVMNEVPTLDIEDLPPEGDYTGPIRVICEHAECLHKVRPYTHLCNKREEDTIPFGYELHFCKICEKYREKPI